MNKWKTKLILPLSVLALLAGCDEGSTASSTERGLFGWLESNKEQPDALIGRLVIPDDYIQETQAGNYLAAQFAQYRQDWKMANKYLDRIMAADPGNIELQQRAMVLALQAGDTNRAIALARKVQKADEDNVLALMFIGVDQMARQEYDAAVGTFEKIPQSGIADFIRPILIAWAKAPAGTPPADDALFNHGPLHAYHALLITDYQGDVKDAETYFGNILASGDVDAHVLETVADIFARNGKTELSAKIYDALIEQYQSSGALAATLIHDLKQKRDHPETVTEKPVRTPAEGASEAFYNMARVLYQDSRDDSALVFSRLGQMLQPGNEKVKLLTARMMMRNGHVDEAIAIYKSIQSDSEEFLSAQRSAAELMEEEGRLEDSIAYLEKIYEEHKDVNALVQIGDAYRRAERHEDAIAAYNRAADALGNEIGADYWHLLYARGMSYERNGDLKHSEEDLEKALAFHPDHPYLLNYLGYSWADQGKNLEQSLDMITKAVTLRPDDGYIVDSLGWIYYQTGQYDKAVAELEKAIELIPYDPTINDHLGDAYWRVGRKHEARFQWQRAINHAEAEDEALKLATQKKIENGLTDIPEPPVMQAKQDAVGPVSETAKR